MDSEERELYFETAKTIIVSFGQGVLCSVVTEHKEMLGNSILVKLLEEKGTSKTTSSVQNGIIRLRIPKGGNVMVNIYVPKTVVMPIVMVSVSDDKA